MTAHTATQQFPFLNSPFTNSDSAPDIPYPDGKYSLSSRSCPGPIQLNGDRRVVPLNGQRPRLVRTFWRPGARSRQGEAASKQGFACTDSVIPNPPHDTDQVSGDPIVSDKPSRVGSSFSEHPEIDSTVENAGRETDASPKERDNKKATEVASSCELESQKEDFFGDCIEGEEALLRPTPTCGPLDSRTPTPELGSQKSMERLATDPDRGDRSDTRSNTPSRPLPSHLHSPPLHPLYRCEGPPQPTVTYPRVWQLHTLNHPPKRKAGEPRTEKQDQIPAPAQNPDPHQPKSLSLVSWLPLPERTSDPKPTNPNKIFLRSLLNGTASSHWSFYIIQILLWSALTAYFFYHVSHTPTVLAFDCYELKVQLLHLFANATLSRPDASSPPANATSSSALQVTIPQNASSIPIPEAFRAALGDHCILHPVHRTVMLASSYGIVFVGMLAACGIAYLLEALVLTQFRGSLVRSGERGRGTLVVRLGVRGITAGVACSVVAGSAWAVKS